MGEVAACAQVLSQTGLLPTITDQVHFARARMGTYDLIDFLVVLIGDALSGEPTLQAFYDRLLPFADSFMALFARSRLPSRSALSRFFGRAGSSQCGERAHPLSARPAGPIAVF
jgi:hypothetical protein